MQQPLTKKGPKAPAPLNSPDNMLPPASPFSDLTGADVTSPLTGWKMGTFAQMASGWASNLSDYDTRRLATHFVVIAVIALAITLNSYNLFDTKSYARRSLAQSLNGSSVEAPAPTEENNRLLPLPTELKNLFNGVFRQAAVPGTPVEADPTTADSNAAPINITEIRTYAVESGDTIYGIAAKFGISPETIMWSNESLGNNPDILSVGQELIILPVDGVYHQVGSGDTIEGIAATFKANPTDILSLALNELDPANPIIQPGQWLVVPGGSKPFVPRTVTAYTGPIPDDATTGTGAFGWPASGSIFQGYWSAHPGVDIAAWAGAPVLAADSGYVLAAGWDNTGYGYAVVIDHGNGFQTLYGHLQAYYVDAGDNVVQGQQIGEMGSTGNSTGPHLHFEVRQGTVQRNPIGFLP